MANPTVTITNNTSIEVEIFDVYNHTNDPKGILTYTSLGKVAAGQSASMLTKHFASQLQAMYTGKVAALNDNYYYQFPIKVIAVSGLDDVRVFTISNDDKLSMEQSFRFIKYTMANGASKISKDFITALGNSDQKTTVDAFFAKTASFAKCTLSTWTATVAWQTQFLNAWQGPYYLYNLSADAKDVKLISVVNIVSNAKENTAKIYIANKDGKTDANSQSTDITAAGDGIISEKDVGSGAISVSLQPIWMNVTDTDSSGNVRYLIGSALSGTLNGIKVLGTGEKIDLSSPSAGSSGGKSSEDWFKANGARNGFIVSIIGLISSLGMLAVMVMQGRKHGAQASNDVENKAKDPEADKAKVEAEKAKVEADNNKAMEQEVKPKVEEAQKDVDKLPELNDNLADAEKEVKAIEVVEVQVDKLKDILEEVPPNDAVEEAAEKLGDAEDKIKDGKADEALPDVADAADVLQVEAKKAGSQIKKAQEDQIDKVAEDMKEAKAREAAEAKAKAEKAKDDAQDPDEPVDDDSFEDAPEEEFTPEVG